MEAVCAAPDAAASPGEERCHQNHQSRRTSSNSVNNNSTSSRERVVYLRLGSSQKIEAASFRSDTAPDELKELFRSAAEAGPLDIVKLYGTDGRLINISPALQSNAADRPYRLEVVAAHCNGMLLDEVGVDLRALEERVALLEKQIQVDFEELPPSVQELKTQVDKFRTKLETTEHLSWLGFYKDLPPPLSTEACRRLQYRRKSDSVRRRVRDKFYKICDVAVSDEVRHRLRQPTFDGCQWEDEEVLLLLQQMYIDLDLTSKFCIEMPVLRRFLYEVYNNYNEVPFHNFRHSFCVAQMMYAMMWAVDLPSKLGDLETLILLTSCICHDLDHPGYNNIYQINAKTELALRYNDISPLENHHCSVAFRLLERSDCNILKTLNPENFRRVREGIIRCILATDMARHNEILAQFREIIPTFDFNDRAHTNLLCMVLIKVADISNEARPMDVAEPWLDRLLQEFFKQSDAEKLEGLPVTPFMDRDKITKPSSQCSFIGFVLLPLFEALGELFPELQDLIVQPVRDALDYYRRLNEAAKDEHRAHRKSVAEASGIGTDGDIGSSGGPMVKSNSGQSVKSRRTFGSLGSGNLLLQSKSRSRSGEEETVPEGESCQTDILTANADATSTDNMSNVAEEDNINSDDIEEEDETVTEVEVSEKTLKFKIATSEGRRSYPGSRKGSRDRDGDATSYGYGGRKRSVASPATSSGGGVGGSLELCNGGGRGSSPRSSSDSRPGDKETCSPGDTFCSSKTATVTDVQLVSASAKPSFLSRIKNFTERFTFGSGSGSGGSHENTPTKQKAVTSAASSLPSLNRGTSTSTETDGRAMTLPKTRKPNRPRGWRALLSSGGRAETVSSMEVIPSTTSPSKKQKNLPVESQESEAKLIVDKNNVNQHNRRGQALEMAGTNSASQNSRGNSSGSSGWMSSFAENLRSGSGSRHRGNKGAPGSED